jgi:hypothetical protein
MQLSAQEFYPESALFIASLVDEPIFIFDSEIMSREQLMKVFPFDFFQTYPEDILQRQMIIINETNSGKYEYVVGDEGDQLAAKYYVQTNIYLGKQKWAHFRTLGTFAQSLKAICPAAASNFRQICFPQGQNSENSTTDGIHLAETVITEKKED